MILDIFFLIVGGLIAFAKHKQYVFARYFLAVSIPGLSLFLHQKKTVGTIYLLIQGILIGLSSMASMKGIYIIFPLNLFIRVHAVAIVYLNEKGKRRKSSTKWQQDN